MIGAEVVAAVLLLAVLGFAVIRPARLPEAVMAVPAAVIVLVSGGISVQQTSR